MTLQGMVEEKIFIVDEGDYSQRYLDEFGVGREYSRLNLSYLSYHWPVDWKWS